MSEKTLGQVAHEAGEQHDGWARRWGNCSNPQKDAFELIAQAVVSASLAPQWVDDEPANLAVFAGRDYREVG